MSKNNKNNKGNNKGGKQNQNHYNRNGKSNNIKNAMPKTHIDACDVKESPTNDPVWYAANPQLLRDSASYSYNQPLGTVIDLTNNSDYTNTRNPGILTLQVSPTYGYADDANHPMNVAMRNIYTYVRHVNSGSANYDAPDLMLYIMAYDACNMWLEFMKRIYGTCQLYNVLNRYYPKAIVEAQGVDYDDVVARLASFRAAINVFAVKMANMCVPATMPIFTRHAFLMKGVYQDSLSDKAQLYMFNPKYMVRFNEVTEFPDGFSRPALTYFNPWDDLDTTRLTCADLIDIANSMFDPMLSSESMNIMSGDILKAYGNNVFRPTGITETYTVLPTYDANVMLQIHNSVALGDFALNSGAPTPAMFEKVNEEGLPMGWLVSKPTFKYEKIAGQQNAGIAENVGKYTVEPLTFKKVIDFPNGPVEPAGTIEATRLTNIITTVNDDYTMISDTIGCDIVHDYTIWTLNDNGNVSGLTFGYNIGAAYAWDATNVSTEAAKQTMFSFLAQISAAEDISTSLSQFDMHPMVYSRALLVTGDVGTVQSVRHARTPNSFGEFNYFTVLNDENLRNMNRTALLSLFDVK